LIVIDSLFICCLLAVVCLCGGCVAGGAVAVGSWAQRALVCLCGEWAVAAWLICGL
jgi:hypothetical protein